MRRSVTLPSLLTLLTALTALVVGVATAARAQNWLPIPIVKQSTLDAGFTPGGEGGQVIRCMATSATDANFLLMGTDVGGIYRSLNGGARWEPCNVGYHSRGANDMAVDPMNANRVLVVAGNSEYANFGNSNGVYLSTNKGASWSQRLPKTTTLGGSIAYDKSSYNSSLGYCTRAYYVHPSEGVYRSTDGGSTWSLVYGGYWNTMVKVHPTTGVVYLASSHWEHPGFFRSTNQGVSWTQINSDYNLSMDVIDTYPDRVYVSRWSKVWVSYDSGLTFGYIGNNYYGDGLPDSTEHHNIKVSPVNPSNMLVSAKYGPNWWEFNYYYSNNGGNSWSLVSRDDTHAILPNNGRGPVWIWNTANASICYSIGGDFITRSTNAGATLAWYGNGYTGIMVGGTFNFAPTSPNTVLLAFQDYNGAFTLNGGSSWNYRDISGNGWGGYCYGGFALDSQVMWCGNAPSWGGTRELTVTRDGGGTWIKTGLNWSGPDVGYSCPNDSNVGFASNYRTTDRGVNWSAMTGCQGVYTHNPTNSELYGKNGDSIVRSTNKGASWTTVVTVPGGFNDLAYDQVRNRFYVASEDRLKYYQGGTWTTVNTPTDQYGSHRIRTVAVDPVNPDVVYAGGHRDIYACNNSVVRSTDAAQNWENIHVNATLSNSVSSGQKDGPHEVSTIRVHPTTRYAWVSGQCYGMWKIAPPGGGGGGTGSGLRGQYFNNLTLTGSPALTRTETTVDFDWGSGSPGGSIGSDNFSVRWEGEVQATSSGSYTFQTVSDDGVRLWVNGTLVIDNWTDHAPTTNSSGPITLNAGQRYAIKMEYYEKGGGAVARLHWTPPGGSQQAIPQSQLYPAGTGLRGHYFNNKTLTGSPTFTRTDATVNFAWSGSPGSGVGSDNFSVRWEGEVEAPVAGTYTFYTRSDDGVRLWVNGTQVINNWTDHAPTDNTGSPTLSLSAGQKVSIRMEFYESGGGAEARLYWSYPGQAKVILPQNRLFPAP